MTARRKRIDEMTGLYEEHKGILISRANYYTTSGHVFDDLLSEANANFVRAFDTWDHERPFKTWLYVCVNSGLLKFIKRNQAPRHEPEFPLINADTAVTRVNPFREICVREEIQNLSEEAREIVQIIIDGPADTLNIVGGEPPRKIRGLLLAYLRACGWTWPRIWRAFGEIKVAVAAM